MTGPDVATRLSLPPRQDLLARPSILQRLATAGLPPLPRMAWLELDLDALTANLAAVRTIVGAGTAVHPVVKADAYGHGALPITRALEAAGADGFCVAALDEALALRDGGVLVPIRVLYPIPPELARLAAAARVGVSAGDDVLLRDLLAVALTARPGDVADGAPGERLDLAVELEVETGLGRGGFLPRDLLAAARRVSTAPGVRLAGLWTHLQATEDARRTADQLRRFEAACDGLAAAGIRSPARHVAASGGLLTGVPAFDGVRPGLTVYGLLPDELEGSGEVGDAGGALPAGAFRPVMSLHAQPVRVLDLPTGHGISYGPTFVTSRPSRIATLPLGYGDGFSRSLSNRAEALVRGCRVPIVGNVAMDAVMVDVTDVPGRPVTVNDEFVLLGRQGDEWIRADDLARQRGTNRWEVVTQMAARLPRVYHAASAAVDLRTLAERRG